MPPHFTHSALLAKYRIFLSKLTNKTPFEENGLRQKQRNSKLLLRLRNRALLRQSSIDPFRAFRKLNATIGNLKNGNSTRSFIPFKSSPLSSSSEFQDVFGKANWLRSVLIFALGGMSKVFMSYGNSTFISGKEYLEEALNREEGRALITVSNHTAALDDPLVLSTLVPQSVLFQSEKARWTLCATDRCFKNAFLTSFFRSVKVLPVERGAGLNQRGMKAAERCLNEGGWIHVFPEGTRSRNGELLQPRLGIGKLVANCDQLPLVIPFVHSGMEAVMPAHALFPKPGNKVRVLVGGPISFGDVVQLASERGWTDFELYQAISQKIGVKMAELWSKLENKPLPSWARNRTYPYPFQTRFTKEMSRTQESFHLVVRESIEIKLKKTFERQFQLLNEYLEYCKLRFQLVQKKLKIVF